MADSTTDLVNDVHHAAKRDASPPVIHEVLDGLVGSSEPAVVFSSLVRLAVPLICDRATATITGPDEKVYAVSWPRDEVPLAPSRRTSVVVDFQAPATEHHDAFHGEVTLGFGSADASQPYVAQLIVDRAMATVERERLRESLTRSQMDAANLEVALTTNREISVAVGILTATHLLKVDEAFDLLRRASQNGNRKLHDLALEVIANRGMAAAPAPDGPESGRTAGRG